MRAGAAVAREDYALACPVLVVQPMIMVQRPERVESLLRGLVPLLPIYPPEVHALILKRMVDSIEIACNKVLVLYGKGYVPLCLRVEVHIPRHIHISLFKPAQAKGRVQIQARPPALLMQLLEKRNVIREQALVPGVSRPALRSPVFLPVQALFTDAELPVDIDVMPVHVDDGYGYWYTLVIKALHEFKVLVLSIRPIAAPPVAKRPARYGGRAAAYLIQRPNRPGVVVTVGKHIEVAGALRARHQFSIGHEQETRRVVQHRDAAFGAHAESERYVFFVVNIYIR